MGIREDIDWYTEVYTDAKRWRDENNSPDAKCDEQYRLRVVEGDFTGLIRGWRHPEMAETYGTGLHRTRVENPHTIGVPKREFTAIHDPGGQQGAKPAVVNRVENGRMVGERPGPGGNGRYGTRKQQITRGASEKQVAWIESMVEEITALDPEFAATVREALDGIKGKNGGQFTGGWGGTASKAIDLLKPALEAVRKEAHAKAPAQDSGPATRTAPRTATARTRTPLPTVDDGYYAVPNADGELRFYRVKNHRNGRVYVNVRASATWHNVRFGAYAGILGKIAEDPEAAGKRYADALGQCYRCSRVLTDETSRQLGIGPHCRSK